MEVIFFHYLEDIDDIFLFSFSFFLEVSCLFVAFKAFDVWSLVSAI